MERTDKKTPTGLGQRLQDKLEIKTITYMDNYFYSPFVTLIVGEIIHALKRFYGNDWSNPKVFIKTSATTNEKLGYQLKHSWHKDDVWKQEQVIQGYFNYIGLNAICGIYESIPHHRPLIIKWNDGKETVVYLDHGFGFIDYDDEKIGSKIRLYNSFDFRKSVKEQIEQIYHISKTGLKLKNASSIAIITIRE